MQEVRGSNPRSSTHTIEGLISVTIMSLFFFNEYGVSSARPAPSQFRQDRKVAAAGGCSGAMQGAYPIFFCPISKTRRPAGSLDFSRQLGIHLSPASGRQIFIHRQPLIRPASGRQIFIHRQPLIRPAILRSNKRRYSGDNDRSSFKCSVRYTKQGP